MGQLHGIMVDIEGESLVTDFKVIDIVEDDNPYLALFGIGWAIAMNGVINLKKHKIFFFRKSHYRSGTLGPCGGIMLLRASARLREK